MKPLTILSVILDISILLGFLFLPRTGMEAMGTAFLLLPLMASRIVVTIIGLVSAYRRKKWGFLAYTFVMLTLMAGLWRFGWSLKPTYIPLYKALLMQASKQGEKASDYKDQKKYDARRLLQKACDADHARLCDLLAEQRNPADLKKQLSRDADLSKTCVTFEGDRVEPVLHAVIQTYGPWPDGPRKHPPVDPDGLHTAVRLLLEHGANPNARDRNGNTPLHYALAYRDENLVDILLAGGACVFIKNDKQESPYRFYSSSRLQRKVRAAANDPAMVSRCPDMHQPSPGKPSGSGDRQGALQQPQWPPDTALLKALRSGRLDEAADALGRGAAPNAVDRKGSTMQAAMQYCRDTMLSMMQMLLEAGADVNLRNGKGQTPLIIAAFSCAKAIPFLLERGADPTLTDKTGESALHGIVRLKAETMTPLLEQLLAAGADINHQNRHGQTPLIRAAYSSMVRDAVGTALLEHGADPNRQDYRGDTILHILAADSRRSDSSGLIRRLLAHGARLDIRNRGNQTPLMAAVARKHVSVVRTLVEAGADVNVRDKQGTPLIGTLISCDADKLAMLRLIVDAGADVNAASEYGPLPLSHAFYGHLHLDCLEPARILLNAGADPNRQDRNGTAPIHSLAHWNRKDPAPALKLLLDHGARIDIRNQQGMTTLLLAGRYGTSTTPMQALLERGADVQAVDENGNTLLHCIAMNTKPGGSERLAFALTAGCDPSAVNRKGETPLDRARRMRNQPMIDAFSNLTH
jgi:ankyrin repeat protein